VPRGSWVGWLHHVAIILRVVAARLTSTIFTRKNAEYKQISTIAVAGGARTRSAAAYAPGNLSDYLAGQAAVAGIKVV
jgi:hypothetical protein